MQIVIDNIREDFLYEIKHKHPNMRTELEQSVLDGTILPKGHERLIDADKVKKNIIDWFMYTVNSKHNSIPKDCDELIKYITGWVTYAIDKTPTIIEADKKESEDTE